MDKFKPNMFQQLLEEVLTKTSLFEMAHTRQKALDIMTGLQSRIAEHFIKVAIFPNDINVTHWTIEIAGWLKTIDQLVTKPNGKKLKFDDYFKILYDEPIGHEDGVYLYTVSMKKAKDINEIPQINFDLLQQEMQQMYEQLCDDLSLNKFEGIDYYIDKFLNSDKSLYRRFNFETITNG